MATPNVQENDRFLKHVSRVREGIKMKFQRAHQVLGERETELLSELDQLEERYRGDDVPEQINELNKLKEMQLAAAKRNENKDLVMQHVSELEDRVKKIKKDWEKERASMRRVELKWDARLETRLSKLGAIRVSAFRDYKEIENPVMSAGTPSIKICQSAGVFRYPRSIAIHPETNNVYICEGLNDHVQVFTNSLQFLFDICEGMDSPTGLCISNNSVYVTQCEGHCLNEYTAEGKFLKSVGNWGMEKLEFIFPRGVDVSKDRIYVCDHDNNRIQCLNMDFTFNSIISDITEPLDIKLTAEEIVVLARGDHCIRYYNYTHQLIRKIIPRDGIHVIEPNFFCMDNQGYIFMSDEFACCVSIFTSSGELVHRFGHKGPEKGGLYNAAGIALDSHSRIIVASLNLNYTIQIFD